MHRRGSPPYVSPFAIVLYDIACMDYGAAAIAPLSLPSLIGTYTSVDMRKGRVHMALRAEAERPHRPVCACQGVTHREPQGADPAVELWFYSDVGHVRAQLLRALGALLPDVHTEDVFVKVPAGGASLEAIEAAADALSPTESNGVKVAWMVPGNNPYSALMQAQTLTVVKAQLHNGWFTRLLDQGGLFMHFQPIVSLQRDAVVAHEALVRGLRDGFEVSGGEIVSVAQAAQLLVPLDARTRTLAIEQFDGSGLEGKLFINFQPSAIYNPRYCLRTTFAALERSSLRPEDIVFEVVESEGVTDLAHLREIVEIYRAHGLAVAMDDMGSGQSSLERVLSLRPDYVKIDKSIAGAVVDDQTARLMVQSIVHIASSGEFRVIAEGIESVEQRDVLRDLGVELGQGYLYARPALRPRVAWPS